MKKRILLSFVFLGVLGFSQTPNFQWAAAFNGPSYLESNAIVSDSQGNSYVCGSFQGICDFDPGPGSFTIQPAGSAEVFVCKLNPSGQLLWAKSCGGTGIDFAESMALDVYGNLFITGEYEGSAEFDPGPGSFSLNAQGFYDVFVLKLDTGGNFIWAKSVGGNGSDVVDGIVCNQAGDCVFTGHFDGTADFDPGPGTFSYSSTSFISSFACALDSSGTFGFAKVFTGDNNIFAHCITLDSIDNIIIGGGFWGTSDFDPGPAIDNHSSMGGLDCFLIKLNVQGNYIWAKTFGGLAMQEIYATSADANGNILSTGYFGGTCDFDPHPVNTFTHSALAGTDIFVSKLDALGQFQWAKAILGSNMDSGKDVGCDLSGNVYVSGFYNSIVDFDPGPGNFTLSSVGASDAFLLKLNASGNFNWALGVGGTQSEEPNSISIQADAIFCTGEFSGSGDFDPGPGTSSLTSAGTVNAFVLKLTNPPVGLNEVAYTAPILMYPNPAKYYVNILTPETVTFKLFNLLGKEVVTQVFESGINRLALTPFPEGIYIIQVLRNGQLIRTEKILVQK